MLVEELRLVNPFLGDQHAVFDNVQVCQAFLGLELVLVDLKDVLRVGTSKLDPSTSGGVSLQDDVDEGVRVLERFLALENKDELDWWLRASLARETYPAREVAEERRRAPEVPDVTIRKVSYVIQSC